MVSKELMSAGGFIINQVKRRISMLLIAFMLGMSNVILEEDRMVNNTREHIEQQEITPEEDLHDTVLIWINIAGDVLKN